MIRKSKNHEDMPDFDEKLKEVQEENMGEGIHFERGVEVPDGIHDSVEKNEYRTTNAVALALIGASVAASIVGAVVLAIIL